MKCKCGREDVRQGVFLGRLDSVLGLRRVWVQVRGLVPQARQRPKGGEGRGGAGFLRSWCFNIFSDTSCAVERVWSVWCRVYTRAYTHSLLH